MKSKIDIIPPKDIWTGSADAPVQIVMWGDYESQACADAHEVIRQVMELQEGRVRFNFRHFPLTQIHQKAHKAAEAAILASQTGKFWAMHDLIFRNRRNLGSISLRDYAIEAGVSDKNFLPKLTDSVFGWTVRNDLMEGLARGIRNVPAIYINDRMLEGKITVENITKQIPVPRRKKAA
jgi:protein-disulfide isomerase